MSNRRTDTLSDHPTVRFSRDGGSSFPDCLIVEEPLAIQVGGEVLATTMRTPGHDRELALGFLYSEGIIRSAEDVGAAVHCGPVGDPGYGNVLDVRPAPGTAFDIDRAETAARATLTTAACGVCGRKSIDDLLARVRPLSDITVWKPDAIRQFPELLRAEQRSFHATGGVHAAAVFDDNTRLLALFEDVGRHNAVDKCVGRLLLDGRLLQPGMALVVSGRTSFEIVHKAVCAGLGLVVGLSAASSLAVQTAQRADVTLIGFASREGFNVYTHARRVRPPTA